MSDQTPSSTSAESAKSAPAEDEFILTPEIMESENRRNDTVIAIGVLAFAFFLGAFKESSVDVWSRLKTGQVVAHHFPSLPKTDPLNYTSNDNVQWVAPSWLFDWACFQLYARAGDMVMVGVKAALCAAVAAVMIWGWRLPGPTWWWASVCVLLSLPAMTPTMNVNSGLMSTLATVGLLALWHQARHLGRFSLLFAAIPLMVLWVNLDLMFWVGPALLALAVVGEFLQGMLIGSGTGTNAVLEGRQRTTLLTVTALSVAACLFNPFGLALVLFPWQWFMQTLPQTPRFDLSLEGWIGAREFLSNWWSPENRFAATPYGNNPWIVLSWLITSAAAIGSCFVNFSRPSVTRVLWLLLALALPFLTMQLMPVSAAILAFVLCLNGQDYFLASFGPKTRIENEWVIWSQSGRAISIVAVVIATTAAFTGWVRGNASGYGFGIDNSRYMVEAAEFLDKVKPKGKAFCFNARSANFLAYYFDGPQNFLDSRWQVAASHPQVEVDGDAARKTRSKLFVDYSTIRNGMIPPLPAAPTPTAEAAPAKAESAADADGEVKPEKPEVPAQPDVEKPVAPKQEEPPKPADAKPAEAPAWKKLMDEHGITHVIWDPHPDGGPQNQFRLFRMLRSVDFFPIFISDTAVIFARKDEHADKELFAEHQPNLLKSIFRERRNMPEESGRHATQRGLIDRLWRTRDVLPPGLVKANLYLNIGGPGGYYAAIHQCRTSIAANPDNAAAYNNLARCYASIYEGESAAFHGSLYREEENRRKREELENPKPEEKAEPKKTDAKSDTAKSDGKTPADDKGKPAEKPPIQIETRPSKEVFPLRHHQLMAAYNDAITANPNDWNAHLGMFSLCLQNKYIDLAMHHYQEALRLQPNEQWGLEFAKRWEAYLQSQENLRKANYDKFLLSNNITPDRLLEMADLAWRIDMPKLAAQHLDAMAPADPSMVQAAGYISSIYMAIGQAEKAFEVLKNARGTRAFKTGEWEWYMAQAHLLSGQYLLARDMMQVSVNLIKRERLERSLKQAETQFRNANTLAIPYEVNQTIEATVREAEYLFDLGILRIEIGEADLAKQDFTDALEILPRFRQRPIIELYWGLLSDEKLPERPSTFIEADEIALKLPDPPADNKAKRPDMPAAPAPKKDEK